MTTRTLTQRSPASEWGIEALDLVSYLSRIGHTGPLDPTAATLRSLHSAHVQSIVFENLDVLLGVGVPLDLPSIQDKLVRQGRGGYCHEHNLLFAAVLERLGFPVTRLLARARDDGRVLLPRGHATLLVQADNETWLADVGFGSEGLWQPLALRDGLISRQGAWGFRLERRGTGWVLRGIGAEPSVLYSFAVGDFREPDFEAANYFVSTHLSSPFATDLIVQRATPQARYALRGLDLTITIGSGHRAHQRVAARDLGRVLRDSFTLDVSRAQAQRLAEIAQRTSKRPGGLL